MAPNTGKPHNPAAPESGIKRQLIASGIAVAVMALGAWSLLGQKAPYHPEIGSGDVTRSDTPGLMGAADKN